MKRKDSVLAKFKGVPHLVLIMAIVLTSLMFYFLEPNFGTIVNFRNILIQCAPLVIAAVGMTLVIMTSGIDLSVGAVMLLTGAIMGSASLLGWPAWMTFLVVFAVAVLGGILNGVIVGVIRVPAMIATLATLFIIRGLGGHITEQKGMTIAPEYLIFGTGQVAGISVAIIAGIVAIIVGHFLSTRTVFGRYIQAIGSNEKAARNVGMPIPLVLVATYACAALFFGIASIVQLGRLGAVQPTVGLGYELTVITAVVIGGASLFGGRGSIIGTAFGALFVVVIENGLVLSGASPYVFDAVRGAVLLVAVIAADWGKVKRAFESMGLPMWRSSVTKSVNS